MIHPTSHDARKTDVKYFFIRVGETEYKKIAELAASEDRSINKMANILLKKSLEQDNRTASA